jgi:Tol biopolymer transport system component
LGKLKKIEVAGGLPQAVTDLRSRVWRGGAWNKDEIIIFGDGRVGLFRVSASGGVPVQITSLDFAQHETAHYCPSFLPDGRHFVYTRSTADEGKSAIYLGSVDATPEQQSTKPLVASNSQPVYVPSEDPDTGYLLYVRGGDLVAHPFDNSRLEMKGQAATVARKIIGDIPGAILVRFSASANGVLTFPGSNLFGERLTWFDREGKFIGTAGEPGLHTTFSISPNGAYVAAEKNFGKADETDLWLLDLTRGGASTRFTFGSLRSKSPVWSPDGSRIIFCSNRDGTYNLYQKLATGVNDEEVLLKSSEDKVATSWSRDGRYLLYTVAHPKSKADIWVLPLQGGRKPVPFLRSNFNESHARFSPDGRWVAYTSDETGQDEIYVRSISMNTAGTAVETGGKWPISTRSGSDPRWRGDGRELYYRSRGGELLAVEIATHAAFRAGNPKTLGPLLLGYFGYWDSAADGSRFLSLANKGGPQTYSVVLNWQAGLKK